MDCRCPNPLGVSRRGSTFKGSPVNPLVACAFVPTPEKGTSSGLASRMVKEQKGGNLRSIVWRADLAAPGATQRAAREAPELIEEAAAGVVRPAETLELF